MATLTLEHKQHFEEFGFVKIQGLLDPKEVIDPVISEYKIVLDNLADQLFDNGKIQSKYEDLEFGITINPQKVSKKRRFRRYYYKK